MRQRALSKGAVIEAAPGQPHVMKVLHALAVAVGVFFIFVSALGWLGRAYLRGKWEEREGSLEAEWQKFLPAIMADEERWRESPLLRPRDGGDAGPLLYRYVDYGERAAPAQLLTESVARQLKGSEWLAFVGDERVTGIDLQWMKQLESFGYWECFERSAAEDPHDDSMPDLVTLRSLAKVRLLQGLSGGDIKVAAAEAREMARLAFTTETVLGMGTASKILDDERAAYDEAVLGGLSVEGWRPVDADGAEALRRLLFVPALTMRLLSPPSARGVPISVGRCAGLGEALCEAHRYRGFLEDELPERYEELKRQLEASECRALLPRIMWDGPSTKGQLAPNGEGGVGPRWLYYVPFARGGVGRLYGILGAPNPFSRYRRAYESASKVEAREGVGQKQGEEGWRPPGAN